MRTTVLAASLSLLVLAGCGQKDEGPSKAPASPSSPAGTPPAGTAPAMEAPPASAGIASSWAGRVQKQGPGITMEGTHELVDDEGKSIVLLKSAKVDLTKYEGKSVFVVGVPSQTVEGNRTIVDVREVKVP